VFCCVAFVACGGCAAGWAVARLGHRLHYYYCYFYYFVDKYYFCYHNYSFYYYYHSYCYYYF
jgi:hypothetical protein